MQLTTLLPLLALLASPLIEARDGGHGAAGSRRSPARHAQHARVAEKVSANFARKEQLAQENPKAVRKVKRGANGCRAKGSSFTPLASAPTSAAAAIVTSSMAATTSSAAPVSSAPPASSAEPSASEEAAAQPSEAPSPSPSPAPAPSSAAPAPAPPAESSAAPAPAPSQSSGGGQSNQPAGGVTPNGIKAGLSGTDTIPFFGSHVSWFWNYGPTANTNSDLIFVPTLWGNGHTGSQDASRLSAFESINWNPQYVQGFYEPDCSPPMSSAIDPWSAAPLWDSAIAPWKSKGAMLVSPGMCKQANEDWLTPFKNSIGGWAMWDITSVHINKLDMDGVREDLDHYWNTYGKPMWVTEFACVNDVNGFVPVEDQGQINQYINDIVDLLENDSRVAAYSMSEGEGLAWNWAPYRNGALTESGQTYLNAISKYH